MSQFQIVAQGEVEEVRDLSDNGVTIKEIAMPGLTFEVSGHECVSHPEPGDTAIVTEFPGAPYRNVVWHDGSGFTSIVVNRKDTKAR